MLGCFSRELVENSSITSFSVAADTEGARIQVQKSGGAERQGKNAGCILLYQRSLNLVSGVKTLHVVFALFVVLLAY